MRREYTLAELAAAVGMTERNVRAYRSRGLIRPPRLRGRVGYYGFDHLTQLRLVQALTGRGLSLTLVTQLVQRGVAQTELARMLRDELPEGPAVGMSSAVVTEVERQRPGLLQTLAEHGLGRRTAQGYESDPGLLALANQLAAHGIDILDVTHVCLAGAEAAGAAHERIGSSLRATWRPATPAPEADDDVAGDPASVAVELATTAFRLALTARMGSEGTGPAVSAPAP